MIFLSFEAVATPRLIMKNHGKKRRREEKRRRRRQRVGPRGCYCGHAVILCLRGKLEIIWARHISRTRTFIINSFGIPDFHFLFLYFRALHNDALFFYSALPFCISDQSCCVVLLLLMRERERPLLVITVKIIFSNYR